MYWHHFQAGGEPDTGAGHCSRPPERTPDSGSGHGIQSNYKFHLPCRVTFETQILYLEINDEYRRLKRHCGLRIEEKSWSFCGAGDCSTSNLNQLKIF